jgi:5-deoxy-glucuronate isomerase
MAASLHIKGQGFREGYVELASPATAPLRWMTVGRLGLAAARPYAAETSDEELVLALLGGTVSLETSAGRIERVGARADPFGGGPAFLCLPPGNSFQLAATTPEADLIVVRAPAAAGMLPHVVRPEDAPARSVGAANWARTVWPGTALAGGTERLLVGETLNPPGGWSSYPPHKHDIEDPPREAVYEEIYFFRIKPAGGFGIQRVYERRDAPDALSEVYVVADGDAVIIPRGYHPVVAAPGYQLSYIWALCGSGRRYGAWTEDPAHAWLRDVEPLLNAR